MQGTWASLGMARTPKDWRNILIVVGIVVAGVGGNYAMTTVSKSTVSRKRNKALSELEKEE